MAEYITLNISKNTKAPSHKAKRCCVAALGNFDGVHLGHQEVIRSCIYKAKAMGLQSAVITFEPHPSRFVGIPRKSIMSYKQKLEELAKTGIDLIYTLDFNDHMMYMQPPEFIHYLMNHLEVRAIITGYNFRFGHKRSGDISTLQSASEKFGYQYRAIGPIHCEYHTLSSSYIKAMLEVGAVGIASRLLGRPYSIDGEVVQGSELAKKHLGVPTANIALQDDICYPANGVYLVKAQIIEIGEKIDAREDGEERKIYGIANIGNRPTVTSSCDLIMETHLFLDNYSGYNSKTQNIADQVETDQFKKSLYGKTLKIWPIQFIRPERKFTSIDALRHQIETDIMSSRYIIKQVV